MVTNSRVFQRCQHSNNRKSCLGWNKKGDHARAGKTHPSEKKTFAIKRKRCPLTNTWANLTDKSFSFATPYQYLIYLGLSSKRIKFQVVDISFDVLTLSCNKLFMNKYSTNFTDYTFSDQNMCCIKTPTWNCRSASLRIDTKICMCGFFRAGIYQIQTLMRLLLHKGHAKQQN